jgi:Holliday junction resolvase
MTPATFELLEQLHARHGPREFGKMCQKFLALSFRQAGFTHIEERGVQGVDLDAASDTEKYTTEVKTTVKDSIQFQKKDAEGLLKRTADGYRPLLAVLRLGLFSDWFLVHADRLKPGLLLIDMLRPYRFTELEQRLDPLFDEAVRLHGAGALREAQVYLDEVLRKGVS